MYKLLLLAMYVIFIADMARPVRFLPSFRRRTYSIINVRIPFTQGSPSTRLFVTFPFILSKNTCKIAPQFLNTSEHIWTVRATRQGNTTCQFDHVRHVNTRHVFFNRTLMEGRTRHSVRLRGEFFEDNKSKMYVTTLGFRPMFRAKFIFAVEDNICGVMKLQSTTGSITHYELQVRNSSLQIILYRRCWNHFSKVAEYSREVYYPQCQHLVRLGI